MKCCGNKGKRRRHRFGQKICDSDVALVGNPNTGKSCLFNHLTGMGAITSNYPGTTVDIFEGKTEVNGKIIKIVDLPGIYSLGSSSDDEKVAKDYIIQKKPKAIINIIDATMLERNLYLTLQLLELRVPMVLALNFYEELEDKGMKIDYKKLSNELGIPVVPVDALRGAGIKEVVEKTLKIIDGKVDLKYYDVEYDDHIEKAVNEISKLIRRDHIPKRATSLQILEGEEECSMNKSKIDNVVKKLSKDHSLDTEISRERHGQAALIAKHVSKKKEGRKRLRDYFGRLCTEPFSGTIIMVLVLGIIFSALFFLGGYLSGVFGDLFAKFISDPLNPFVEGIKNTLLRTIIIWGLDGIDAGIQIALPYIAVFYVLLAFLEDSGYLPRMAYLLDRLMHKMHLHGKAVVPMMLGFGCSVPAILATRIMPNKKERIITSILVCLIPCSARTAVILGAVGRFIGPGYALLIYGIVLFLILLTGYVLGKMLPGESTGLIMEMPEIRLPYIKNVLVKSWVRVKDFVFIAFPIIIVGSALLGVLEIYGLLESITKPFAPIINGWLMLPTVAGITLLFGILRKELALEMLFVLGGTSMLLDFMSPLQIFIFVLVVTLYFPCIGTFAVLRNEFGWGKSLIISLSTIVLAVLVGGIVGRLFMFLGVLV